MSKQIIEKDRKETLALQILILRIKELIDKHLKEGCKGHQAELRLIKTED
ncbi:MAG: hypothetical protein HQ551_07730 [Desulfobacteraceae bacterium]|nr:hypothetical protein [Desulfobacteraceae bacterium]